MNAKTRRVSPAGRYRSHFPFSTPRSRYVCLRRVGYRFMCKLTKSLKNISAAHNADDFSVIDDRNAFDPVLID
jgi:hypothetical protein